MGNAIKEKSFAFAVRIVNLYRFLCEEKKEYVLSKQLLRQRHEHWCERGEALQAQSKRDFLSKINIALKEASETMYWLKLLHATVYIDEKQAESIVFDCKEIVALLTSIIKTTKKNLEVNKNEN